MARATCSPSGMAAQRGIQLIRPRAAESQPLLRYEGDDEGDEITREAAGTAVQSADGAMKEVIGSRQPPVQLVKTKAGFELNIEPDGTISGFTSANSMAERGGFRPGSQIVYVNRQTVVGIVDIVGAVSRLKVGAKAGFRSDALHTLLLPALLLLLQLLLRLFLLVFLFFLFLSSSLPPPRLLPSSVSPRSPGDSLNFPLLQTVHQNFFGEMGD